MPNKRFVIDGYGQLELNNVAFRRDGRIEAQCKLSNEFSEAKPAENGMLLAVDNVTREVKMPSAADNLIALNYSTEHLYDERAQGLKNFRLVPGEFYPRLGYLAVGDKFTTNAITYVDSDFSDDNALKNVNLATTPVFGSAHTDGTIMLKKTSAPGTPFGGVLLKAVQKTTMPDGQFALKFQVLKA